jgi:hypothetical protein
VKINFPRKLDCVFKSSNPFRIINFFIKFVESKRKPNFGFDQQKKMMATTTKSFTLISHLSFFERMLAI